MRFRHAAAATAAALAIVLPATAASASVHHHRGPASASLSYIQQNAPADALDSASPALAQYFLGKPSSYVYSNSAAATNVATGLAAATKPLRYTSYAQFRADLDSGALPSAAYPAGSYVIYDPEGGTGWPTPASEQADPEYYMPAFNELAARAGLHAIDTPARDLGKTDTTCTTGQPNLDAYYTGCHIASYAVQGGAGVVVQDQADEQNPAAYSALFAAARADAGTARVWTEVSDQRGTYQQAAAALATVRPDGVFLQVQLPDVSSWEAPLLGQLKGWGW